MESNPSTAADYAYAEAQNAQRDLKQYIKNRNHKSIAAELRLVCDAAMALDDAVALLEDVLRPCYDSKAMTARVLDFIGKHKRE